MAAARAAAMETARMALAPRRDLVGVPSREIILWSRARWSAASSPAMDLAISLLALSTALSTPLPRYFDLSPSRSSTASRSPVEAPEGTAARPSAPPSSTTSTSTVGLPRLSRISRAKTESMLVMACSLGLRVRVAGPPSLGLEGRIHEDLLARGHHHHPALGDRVATAILGRIVADDGSPGHFHVAVDDGTADPGMAVDDRVGEKNGILDVAVGVYAH